MADELRMALERLLRKAQLERDTDFLRDGLRVLSEALMELEVTQYVGAERHERTPERTGQRNGYREREWDTRVGTLELRVPRVRDGGYVPSLLDRDDALNERWWGWSRRRTSRASRRGAWTSWSRPWA
jgi:putative transposase